MQEEDITSDSQARLSFSTDTVFFDTLFTDTISFTRRFRIFNPQKNAIKISEIALSQGTGSDFSLAVNGIQGHRFSDQIVLGKDSLLILVTVHIPSRGEDIPFLVEDSVMFTLNNNLQSVKLVAWGQEAHFFREDSILACDISWTADKPYVLYGSILIDSLCTLNIDAGARIYVNRQASILVKGTLQVNGTSENPVLFRNVRLDIENAPGQWTGLIFLEGSSDNFIDHGIIRNAQFGVRIGTPDNDTLPDLILANSIIENMASYGILAFTSDISAYNTLVNNCIDFAGAHFAGGYYRYQHCTFANYSIGQFSEEPALLFTDNLVLSDGSTLEADLYVRLQNSIVWGNHGDGEELLLNVAGEAREDVLLDHLLLRSSNNIYGINNNILGTDPEFPRFIDPFTFNYQLDSLSPAQDAGRPLSINTDLLGTTRDALPDLGAYERIE